MHQLFSKKVRWALVGISTIGLIFYCMNNYVWNLPHADFRPFAIGNDVATMKTAEENAASSVRITACKLKNKGNGEVVTLANDVYMKQYKDYPKADWTVIDQEKTKPAIEATKVSEFDFADVDGNHYTDEFLGNSDPVFMLVAHKLIGTSRYEEIMVKDTAWVKDTIQNGVSVSDMVVVNKVESINEYSETVEVYDWNRNYIEKWRNVVGPFVKEAKLDGKQVVALIGGAGANKINQFKEAVELDIQFYEADDILLKTMIRSNPGVMLWKNGVILDKWHERKLPDYSQVKGLYF